MSDTTRHKENNIVIDDVQGGEKKVMTKFNKRIINVLATATLVAGVAAPVTAIVAPSAVEAASNGDITVLSTPSVVNNNTVQRVGSIKFEIPKFSTLRVGDTLNIKLPFDLAKKDSVTKSVYTIEGREFVAFSGLNKPEYKDFVNTLQLANDANDLTNDDFEVVPDVSSANTIAIKYVGDNGLVLKDDPAVFTLVLGGLLIDSSDEAKVEFSAPGSSPFPGGSRVVATVAKNKNNLNVSFGSLDTSNERFDPKIVIEEPYPGALDVNTELRIKLPNGYAWVNNNKAMKVMYGDFKPEWLNIKQEKDDQELVITVKNDDATKAAVEARNKNANKIETKIEIPYDFRVEDSTKVKKGDIIARLSGRTSANISEAKIGTYGEYESTLKAEDAPTLVSGQDEQRIADFHITETVGDSIVTGSNGRYLELTLPEGARWQDEYEWDIDGKNKDKKPNSLPTITDEGLTLTFEGFTGNNNRTAKYLVKRDTNNTDAATLDFEDLEVALAPDFTGDLKISVGGSAGVKGDVVVAKAVAPVTAQVASAPDVIIGAREQKAGDFTITEGKAGALVDDGEVRLVLPDGVKFASTPTVKVSGGDLIINNVRRSSDDKTVIFDVEGESDAASTISVSDVNVILDRTVPEGKVELSVEGDAVSETQKYSNWKDNKAVAKAIIAKVSTPAPVEDSKGNTVSIFKIGSTSYTVNGATYTTDVAPYIENGRTFLPVRYVADALGVAPQNIKFDKKTSTVTLLKGDRIVQIKLKTNILTVNGAVINMDVQAKTKNNRTVLPISWVGQALGADIKWDKDTNTVTVTQAK